MGKQKVYIESTVPNYVFNDDYPDEQKVANLVFEAIRAGVFEGYISVIVEDELSKAPEKLSKKLLGLVKPCQRLELTEEVTSLVKKYIDEGAFPKSKPADATHVAVASVHGLGYVFSWNFKHIVRESTIIKVTAINQLLGYKTPKILNPEEVIFDVLEEKNKS